MAFRSEYCLPYHYISGAPLRPKCYPCDPSKIRLILLKFCLLCSARSQQKSFNVTFPIEQLNTLLLNKLNLLSLANMVTRLLSVSHPAAVRPNACTQVYTHRWAYTCFIVYLTLNGPWFTKYTSFYIEEDVGRLVWILVSVETERNNLRRWNALSLVFLFTK